jgi:hypothetical protein
MLAIRSDRKRGAVVIRRMRHQSKTKNKERIMMQAPGLKGKENGSQVFQL